MAQDTKGVRLWDTATPVGAQFAPGRHSEWKAVPNDLLLLEKDPLKASSDPGYYGREYAFEGDAVAETPSVAAVFSSAQGCVTIYAKPESAAWHKVVSLCPAIPGSGPLTMIRNEVVRNADDQIALRASFSRPGSREASAIFILDKTGIVEIKPDAGMDVVRFSSAIAYGVVPAFVGDDLIYGGAERLTNKVVSVPAENMFLGLLEGESTEFVLTWPKGKQRVQISFGDGQAQNRITSVEFNTGMQSFYLAALSAPGIWHKETLTPEFLEKDVKISWQTPSPRGGKLNCSRRRQRPRSPSARSKVPFGGA